MNHCLIATCFLISSFSSFAASTQDYSIPGPSSAAYAELQQTLTSYVADKDASIGIAVIINGNDTVTVNGYAPLPMLSVYKFPQALAVADYCTRNGLSPNDSISISATEILPDTWSPLREKYGINDLKLPLHEILGYSLQLSDNNACDILFRLIGGPSSADSLMRQLNFPDVRVLNTEAEMHADPTLCYANTSSPIAMARLFDRVFRRGLSDASPLLRVIADLMMTCDTGASRIPSPLLAEGVKLAHKTGTGDRNPAGRLTAINDAGYVYLPDGYGYALAVFISDSAYDIADTESMIADISSIVYNHVRLFRQNATSAIK